MKVPFEFEQRLWAGAVGGWVVEDHLWYSACGFNGIFCVDLDSGETELLSSFNAFDEKYTSLNFSYMIQVGVFLYFCPYEANCICEMNICNKEMKFYYSDFLLTPRISNAVCIQNVLYMFCNSQLYIIVFDLKTKNISVIRNEVIAQSFIEGNFPEKDVAYDRTSFYITTGSRIIEFNVQTQMVCEYNINQYIDCGEITAILVANEIFWMTDGTKIISWKKEDSHALAYNVPKLGKAVKSIMRNQNIYIFYNNCNDVLIFDTITKKITIAEVEEQYCCKGDKIFFFHPFVRKNKEGIYIYTIDDHKIIYIAANGEVSYIKLYMKEMEQFCSRHYEDYLHQRFYMMETIFTECEDVFFCNVDSLLLGIVDRWENEKKLGELVGEKIYHSI